jgi:ParB family chromosome partitioning protein
MPKNGLNVALKGVDEIFSTEESRQAEQREQVQQIPIAELFPFKDHPFRVQDDEEMESAVQSISQYGVLTPLIARPRPEGGYEIISGHRRQHAAQLADLETVPVIVRDMSDDAATILMVDSNLQRENILPSERAFAYKMKLEAIERSMGRPKNVGQVVPDYFGKRSTEIVAEGTGESYKQVQRFVRLTNLIPKLLDMVDNAQLSFNPAVNLSYLDEAQQKIFIEAMGDAQNAPSLSQSRRIKDLAQQGDFNYDSVYAIMNEVKKDELDKVVIKNDTLRKYFPESSTPREMQEQIVGLLEKNKSTQLVFANDALKKYFPKGYTPEQMENIVVRLLTQWQKKHQHSEER